MKSVLIFSFFLLLNASFADDKPDRFPFLRDIKTLSVIEEGDRKIMIVGEIHESRTGDNRASEPFKLAESETLKLLPTQKVVLLLEQLTRTEAMEIDFLKEKKLEAGKLMGAVRGLEDPALKLYTTNGVLKIYANNSLTFLKNIVNGEKDKATIEGFTNLYKGYLDLFPKYLNAKSREPLKSYWAEASKNPNLKPDEHFKAMSAISDAKQYAAYEKTLVSDLKTMQANLITVAMVTQIIETMISDDSTIPKEKRETLPNKFLKKFPIEREEFKAFLEATSKIREEAMSETILDSMKTFPKHDLVIIVGNDHRAPLEKALRTALKK